MQWCRNSVCWGKKIACDFVPYLCNCFSLSRKMICIGSSVIVVWSTMVRIQITVRNGWSELMSIWCRFDSNFIELLSFRHRFDIFSTSHFSVRWALRSVRTGKDDWLTSHSQSSSSSSSRKSLAGTLATYRAHLLAYVKGYHLVLGSDVHHCCDNLYTFATYLSALTFHSMF